MFSKFQKKIHIGIQDIDHREEGSATGSISASQVKEICKYAIIGHSERRETFFETNEIIREKLLRCWENHITPILCVGESLEIRNKGLDKVKEHLFFQLEKSLSSDAKWKDLIIAYEPIWAIGSGNSASKNEAFEIIELINGKLDTMSGGINIPVLYGGSVNVENFKDFLSIEKISGLLIGSASLHPEDLSKIINNS